MIADLGDDGWLMHRVGDGSTHLLDFVSGEVLLFLSAAPASVAEVAAHLRGFLQDDTLSDDAIATQYLLPLAHNGLIEEMSA